MSISYIIDTTSFRGVDNLLNPSSINMLSAYAESSK